MDKNPAKEIRKKITANWIVVKLCENVVLGGEGGGGGRMGMAEGRGTLGGVWSSPSLVTVSSQLHL